MGDTGNDKNTGQFYRKKVICSKFIRIRPNILLRRVKPIRVTRAITRILDNFVEENDLFKIYAN